MQYFFKNFTHILTGTQLKKFEDMFLVIIIKLWVLKCLRHSTQLLSQVWLQKTLSSYSPGEG